MEKTFYIKAEKERDYIGKQRVWGYTIYFGNQFIQTITNTTKAKVVEKIQNKYPDSKICYLK